MKKNADPFLDALVAIRDLPTLPNVALEVASLLDDPSSTSKQITQVMKADQVLTSKVLKLVNSAYYSIPGGVGNVERAVAFLGYNTIFQLLMGVSVFEFSRLGGAGGIDIQEFWKHSLGVAVASEIIGNHIGYQGKDDLFVAGLLHDIGKIGLAIVAKEPFAKAVQQAHKDGIVLIEAEKNNSLPTHDVVGGVLAAQWRFPAGLREAIRNHHRSHAARLQIVPPHLQSLLDIVILADTLCRVFEIGDGGDVVVPEIDPALLDRLSILKIDLPQIKGEMTRKIASSKIILDILAGEF